MNAEELLEQDFLTLRSRLLDVAASLDRIDRADGTVDGDDRMALILKGIEIAASHQPHRAERIQLLFSRQYDDSWKTKFGLPSQA